MKPERLFLDDAPLPQGQGLLDILAERVAIWNRALAYLLSGVTFFLIGFFAATRF
jgi:hypothetical protein